MLLARPVRPCGLPGTANASALNEFDTRERTEHFQRLHIGGCIHSACSGRARHPKTQNPLLRERLGERANTRHFALIANHFTAASPHWPLDNLLTSAAAVTTRLANRQSAARKACCRKAGYTHRLSPDSLRRARPTAATGHRREETRDTLAGAHVSLQSRRPIPKTATSPSPAASSFSSLGSSFSSLGSSFSSLGSSCSTLESPSSSLNKSLTRTRTER